jgi:hypothetical protein
MLFGMYDVQAIKKLWGILETNLKGVDQENTIIRGFPIRNYTRQRT